MNVIFTIGIFISLFQFVLLLNKKNKSLPDKVLASLMLIIGIHLSSYYLYHLGYWDTYPHLIGITAPLPLFYGPILYLYILYSLRSENHIRKRDHLHFLPAVLSYLYMFQFYFFYSAEEKRLVDLGQIDDFDVFSNLLLFCFYDFRNYIFDTFIPSSQKAQASHWKQFFWYGKYKPKLVEKFHFGVWFYLLYCSGCIKRFHQCQLRKFTNK